MTAKYEREKGSIGTVKQLKAKLDEAKGDLEKYEREYDYNKVAEIKYSTIPTLQQQ
jgi:hypothetical protein